MLIYPHENIISVINDFHSLLAIICLLILSWKTVECDQSKVIIMIKKVKKLIQCKSDGTL